MRTGMDYRHSTRIPVECPGSSRPSHRPRSMAVIADLDDFFNGQDEDFTVANISLEASTRILLETLDGAVDEIVVHGDFQLDLT